MPNQRSAEKRMRSDVKKRFRNQGTISELKTRYKKLAADLKTNPETARELAQALISKLDKAVSHGTIPHRRADRRKARIGRLLHKAAAK